MTDTAIAASANLAGERGAFDMCHIDEIMKRPSLRPTRRKRRRSGQGKGPAQLPAPDHRPTGTLSTMLGISGGIEPIYANFYERKTESLHGTDVYYKSIRPSSNDT